MLIIFGIYIVGIFAIWLWDSFIGFGFEFDGDEYPPLALACLFWPFVFLIALSIGLVNKLNNVKLKRIYREEQREKIRVAAQKELDAYMHEVE